MEPSKLPVLNEFLWQIARHNVGPVNDPTFVYYDLCQQIKWLDLESGFDDSDEILIRANNFIASLKSKHLAILVGTRGTPVQYHMLAKIEERDPEVAKILTTIIEY